MTTLTLTEALLPDHNHLSIPSDTDLADSASIASYMQPVGNSLAYCEKVARMWYDGITSPATYNIHFQGVFGAGSVYSDTGLGGRRQLIYRSLTDANATVVGKDYDVITVFYSTTITADRTLTIDATGAIDGYELWICNATNVHSLVVTGDVAPTMQMLRKTTDGSQASSMHLIFNAGVYRLAGWG
jgi:hypothetical protein